MANYKITDEIISIVFGLLGSITIPKYDKSKPMDKINSEYIVINTLPIDADVMQLCHVNVNYHVKDLEAGMPNSSKLKSVSQSLITLLKKVSTTAYLIDFDGQETFREDALGEHFSNIKFSFKNINN